MTESINKTILLVDDDPLIIRMYEAHFKREGFRVLAASNGEEALVQIAKEKPDLILLDVMMPKMNGVETLKKLKSDDRTSDIPVIMLTNLGDKEEDVEGAKKLGARDYLVKSEVQLQELSAKVKEILDGMV